MNLVGLATSRMYLGEAWSLLEDAMVKVEKA